MPNIEKMEGLVNKELHIFYVLDTSGSMKGAPIAALNDAMRATVEELQGVAKSNGDVIFKIGVMQFDSSVKWVTVNSEGKPIVQFMKDFYWSDLKAGGLTSLGSALEELKKQLSRNYLQKSDTGNKAPIVIFMSDGAPTDSWKQHLSDLKENKWYQQAIKIAFAMGDDADTEVLSQVVGGNEAVIKTSDLETFKQMIRVVSVTSSLVGSTSKVTDKPVTGSDVIKETVPKPFVGNEGGVTEIPPGGLKGEKPGPFDPPFEPATNGAVDIDFGSQDDFD